MRKVAKSVRRLVSGSVRVVAGIGFGVAACFAAGPGAFAAFSVAVFAYLAVSNVGQGVLTLVD